MSLKKDIVVRVGVIYLFMVAFGIIIFGKLLYLQIIDREKWLEGDDQVKAIQYQDIIPNRGNIYSSDGRLLAVSVPYYEVRMDMRSEALKREVWDRDYDSLAICLASYFGMDRYKLKQNLNDAYEKGSRYYLVKRNVRYDEVQDLKKFPIFRLGRYEGGTRFVQQNKRMNPHGLLAQRTIGYIMSGPYGSVVGIEGAYDDELTGLKGLQLMQKIPGGNWMPVNDKSEIEPRDGYDVITTLDIQLQDVAENALKTQLEKHDADNGCVVVMEVETGRVRAIANLGKDKNGNYIEDYNYAIGASIEPGSTFKLASMIALLEDGYVHPDDIVDIGDGTIKYYGERLDDSGDEFTGKITVKRAFEISSNVGISKLVYENYKSDPSAFVNRLYGLGLNQKLGLEIKGEGVPDIKYTDSPFWSGITLPWMSVGYAVSLTPLQMLAFYNAVANDGEMVKPIFVEELQYHGQVVKSFDKQVLKNKICSDQTLKTVKNMLEGVVESGTASNLNNSYYRIAGKTGTCRIAYSKEGYEKGRYHASFVGYFPSDQPKYSCIVVIGSPSKSVYYGNVVAGPVFREVTDKIYLRDLEMQKYEEELLAARSAAPYSKSGNKEELEASLEYLGIPFESREHQSDWVKARSNEDVVELRRADIGSGLLPGVTDMGAKDAVYILESLGLVVEIDGRGTVREQLPVAGSIYKKGTKVKLIMSIREG